MAKEFRVRAAPSPTGKVHIGTIRAYLPNFLLARKYGGKNILRIEDTDQKRLVENGVEAMIEAYQEVGIEFDEGPGKLGGEYGSYIQSERLSIYLEHIQKLVDDGNAYHCFCTQERLEKLRDSQRKNKQKPMYDGHCRDLEKSEVEKRLESGEKSVVRMKFPKDGVTVCKDTIFGTVKFENSDIEDQILLKSDGFPTYHVAVVVDDHLMKISHVIRGVDWLPSFPKHIKLYEYFGWELPEFAHLPLILNPDGRKKLSKRHGAFPVSQILRKGYIKEAILNYAILCGWAPKQEDAHQDEIYTVPELIDLFELERVHKTAARYDQQKFDYINAKHLRRLSLDQLSERVLDWAQRYVLGTFQSDSYTELTDWEIELKEIVSKYLPLWQKDIEYFKKALALEHERITVLSDIPSALNFFYDEKLTWSNDDWNTKNHNKKELADALEAILPKLDEIFKDGDFNHEKWEEVVRGYAQELDWKAGDMFLAIRSATTGRLQSPPLLESFEILGWKRVHQSILDAISWLRS